MAKNECIKLVKVRVRGYVSMREVKILTHYFLVPKGEDIGMVYKSKLSVLNSSLWELNF